MIPQELKNLKKWLHTNSHKKIEASSGGQPYVYKWVDKKPVTKDHGCNLDATVDKDGTIYTYDELILTNYYPYGGLRFGDNLIGIDIDHCIKDGVLDPAAKK